MALTARMTELGQIVIDRSLHTVTTIKRDVACNGGWSASSTASTNEQNGSIGSQGTMLVVGTKRLLREGHRGIDKMAGEAFSISIVRILTECLVDLETGDRHVDITSLSK